MTTHTLMLTKWNLRRLPSFLQSAGTVCALIASAPAIIAGLVDEEAMARNRAQRGQMDFLIEKRPDYVVGDEWFLGHFAHYFPAFRRYTTARRGGAP